MTMGSPTIPWKSGAMRGIYAVLRPCVCMLTVWAALALCAPNVAADSIVYRGVLYEDVLIYKGASSYYVKVPDEGRVFNVPNHEVNPSQVRMVYDPYYRDELKLRFEDAKKRLQSGKILRKRDSGSSFSLADSGDDEFSASDLLERGGGKTSGLGVSLDTVQAMLTAAGMTIATVGGVVTATDASGRTTIMLYGFKESLSKIHFESKAPRTKRSVLLETLNQLQAMISTLAPWTGPWIQQNMMKLTNQGGRIEETREGKHIVFNVTLEGSRLVAEVILEVV